MNKASERIIRWGIMGPGKIARKFAHDLREVPFAELYAVASRDQKRAEAFAVCIRPTASCRDELFCVKAHDHS